MDLTILKSLFGEETDLGKDRGSFDLRKLRTLRFKAEGKEVKVISNVDLEKLETLWVIFKEDEGGDVFSFLEFLRWCGYVVISLDVEKEFIFD